MAWIVYRWHWMKTNPYPLDYDAFYYLTEIKHRIEFGEGYYTHNSLFFFIISALVKISGVNVIDGYYLAVIGALALFACSLYMLQVKETKSLFALAFPALVFNSDALFYLHYGFLKQVWGMAIFTLSLALFAHASRIECWRGILRASALAAFTFSCIFHLSSAVIGLFSATSYLIFRGKWKLFAPLLIVAVGIFLLHWSANTKPVLESFQPYFNLPWRWAMAHGWMNSFEYAEYSTYFIASILFVLLTKSFSRTQAFVAMLPYLISILPLWSDEFAFRYRLMISSTSLFFLCLSITLGKACIHERKITISWLIVILCGSRLFFEPGIHKIGPGMPVESLSSNVEKLDRYLPKDAFIVAPHGIQFRITYFLNRPSARRLPKNFPTAKIFFLDENSSVNCLPISSLNNRTSDEVDCVRLDAKWILRSG
ncbi:MAG: hypothetical protein GYA55_02215 [SAR324 cluster bacterium]|uniref:Uncharacterized protein n=1 Tax=SAR324 cluster bacterium TaxID=2024889 RepID=A0A7X9IIE4_9DELT|nr:hypothetical protein [SAR324 cluster bacterium]